MKYASFIVLAAVAMTASTPAFAAVANPAASLSIGRVASPSGHKSKIGSAGTIVALGVAAAIVGAIVVVATDSDKDRPTPASR